MTGEELVVALNDVQETAVTHLLAIPHEEQDIDKDKSKDKSKDKGKSAKRDSGVVMG